MLLCTGKKIETIDQKIVEIFEGYFDHFKQEPYPFDSFEEFKSIIYTGFKNLFKEKNAIDSCEIQEMLTNLVYNKLDLKEEIKEIIKGLREKYRKYLEEDDSKFLFSKLLKTNDQLGNFITISNAFSIIDKKPMKQMSFHLENYVTIFEIIYLLTKRDTKNTKKAFALLELLREEVFILPKQFKHLFVFKDEKIKSYNSGSTRSKKIEVKKIISYLEGIHDNTEKITTQPQIILQIKTSNEEKIEKQKTNFKHTFQSSYSDCDNRSTASSENSSKTSPKSTESGKEKFFKEEDLKPKTDEVFVKNFNNEEGSNKNQVYNSIKKT